MAKKQLTSRQAQAIKTRNHIYKVAIDLMDKKGFNNVTIADISKKAGVSVGSFYHYFNSKNDIFIEIFRRADEYFLTQVQPQLIPVTEADATLQNILIYFKHYAQFNVNNGVEMCKQLYISYHPLFLDSTRYMHTLLIDIIRQGKLKGEIKTDDTDQVIVSHLKTLARGVIHQWSLENASFSLVDRMQQHIRIAVRAFITP